MKETGRKVLVAFRTLPGDAYSCLVIPTESLDDSYHNALINLVEGNAAQTAYEFAEALDRTQFPDGSRMLPSLHAKGKLVKVPTDQVVMTPTISSSVLLSELNQIIAEQRGVAVDDLHVKPSPQDKVEVKEVASVREIEEAPAEDFSRTTSGSITTDEQTLPVTNESESVEPLTFNSPDDEAKHYRSQADKLAKEAAKFRRLAEELVPAKKKKA